MKFNARKVRTDTEVEMEVEVGAGDDLCFNFSDLVEDFLVRTRRIILTGDINEVVATHVCNNLQMLSAVKAPIFLYIHSQGGCLSSGYAIIDQMAACPCPVYTIVRGYANSMGAIIAAYGSKGHRFITPNSSMMLHSVIVQNPPDSLEKYRKVVRYIENDYKIKVRGLSRRTKLTTQQLMTLMEQTKWMDAKQAIEIGLVDRIWIGKMDQKITGALLNANSKA